MRGILVVVVVGVFLWLVGTTFLSGPAAAGEAGGNNKIEDRIQDEVDEGLETDNNTAQGRDTESSGFAARPDAVIEDRPATPELFAEREEPKIEPPVAVVKDDPLGTAQDSNFEVQLNRGDPGELGRLLLHDPGRLQGFLNDGAGKELPVESKKLVTAFCLATSGNFQSARELAAELKGASGPTTAQLGLLEDALGARGPRARAASSARFDPLAYAMRMVLVEGQAEEALRQNQSPEAASTFSDLIQLEIQSPWEANRQRLLGWAESLNTAQNGHRFNPKGEWPSIDYEVKPGQSLVVIRQDLLKGNPNLLLCTGLMHRANGLGKYLRAGQNLRIPTEHANVLVDLDARLLMYRHGTEIVQAWEVGIGKEGHDTPIGEYAVGDKQEEPSWMPIGGPSLPYGHQDNPLGTRWIAWYQNGSKTSFGFHGTWDEAGVGERVSLGCVRMRNADVEKLFEILPRDARVVVQP